MNHRDNQQTCPYCVGRDGRPKIAYGSKEVSSATRKGPPLRHELGTTPSAVIGQALTSFW